MQFLFGFVVGVVTVSPMAYLYAFFHGKAVSTLNHVSCLRRHDWCGCCEIRKLKDPKDIFCDKCKSLCGPNECYEKELTEDEKNIDSQLQKQ